MNIKTLRKAIDGFYAGLSKFVDAEQVKQKYQRALEFCQNKGKDGRIRLIKADLSGIQSFIYNVKYADDVGGKVAKRLRGRSFFVSAICLSVAEEICLKFSLPEDCILNVSGGKALIMAPDSNKIETKFVDYSRQIDEWLWTKFWGAIYMNLVISKPLLKEDLEKNYVDIGRDLQNKIEENKLKKFHTIIPESRTEKIEQTNQTFKYESHVFRIEYSRECHSCNQLPGVKKINPDDEQPSLCVECYKNQLTGEYKKLPSHNRLEFVTKEPAPGGDFYIKFHNNIYGMLKPTDEKSFKHLPRIPAYVKQWNVATKEQDLCQKCTLYQQEQQLPEDCQNDLQATRFHCLAADAEGAKKIGILAGDLDNLSVITNSIPGLTLLDLTLLSQAIYTFFADYLIDGLMKDRSFYIVYSGGDDFLLVGVWNEIVKLAGEIREKLQKFSKGFLTFSAGLIITNPQDPIYESAELAHQLLKEAKDHGKNHIKAMGLETGTMIDWKQYQGLLKKANWLNSEVRSEENPDGAITIGFLFNLYQIYELYQRWRKEQDTEGLRYLGLLSSHLKRNLDATKPNQKQVLEFFDHNLMDLKNEDVLPYFRFILDYVVFSQRT